MVPRSRGRATAESRKVTRRSAPRRKVVEMWTTGAYGTTVWHHRLECGHIEGRKRKAPAPEIGCLRCEAQAAIERQTPIATASPASTDAQLGSDVAILRAQIAGALGLPIYSVTVELSVDSVAGAVIFLEPRQIIDLLDK